MQEQDVVQSEQRRSKVVSKAEPCFPVLFPGHRPRGKQAAHVAAARVPVHSLVHGNLSCFWSVSEATMETTHEITIEITDHRRPPLAPTWRGTKCIKSAVARVLETPAMPACAVRMRVGACAAGGRVAFEH